MAYEQRTSETHPIYVDFVPDKALPNRGGRIGMTLAPGVNDGSTGGFLWNRNLDADLRRLKETFHTSLLVPLMQPHEYKKYGIPNLLNKAATFGIETDAFEIEDVNIPLDTEAAEYRALVYRLVEALNQEEVVVVHCRGGLGRTGLVVASVLVALGHPAGEAVEIVRATRDGTIQTEAQENYVHEFEKEIRS